MMTPNIDQDINSLPLIPEQKRRIAITVSCKDCETIPKIPQAGEIFEEGNEKYQLMHNGIKIIQDCYGGRWMRETIRLLKGHHEPQEEKVFFELLNHLDDGAKMLELGSFWSYYSLWFNKQINHAKNYLIEPDPNNLEVGKRNFALNGTTGNFLNAAIGKTSVASAPFICESDNSRKDIPVICIDDFIAQQGIDFIDLLLCDIQGFELEMLQGAIKSLEQKKIRFLIISTHHHSISHDPLTHQKCLRFLQNKGIHVLVSHNIIESYSGDGLIVASTKAEDTKISVEISRNYPTNCLFKEMEYDLADAWGKINEQQEELIKLQSELNSVKKNSKSDIQLVEKQLQIAQTQADKLKNLLLAIESSKFWKLRKWWFYLKQKLNIVVEDTAYQSYLSSVSKQQQNVQER
ncbi:MAG: FkbM family methyltransferase [Xenococcus sp. MO_188.B8]|nr:FkbM family methyltransferase [Xenococcus sp. MO_188.B8]